MEPQTPDQNQPVTSATEPWHAPLNRVTTVSKTLAAIVFITLPFVGFWLGMGWGEKSHEANMPLPVYVAVPEAVIEEPQREEVDQKSTPTTRSDDGTYVTFSNNNFVIRYPKVNPKELEVLKSNDLSATIQTIPWDTKPLDLFLGNIENEIIADYDINYDGHNDLLILYALSGVGGNYLYNYRVFNSVSQQFEEVDLGIDQEGGLSNPTIDSGKKVITYSFKQPIGWCSMEYQFNGEKYASGESVCTKDSFD